ncbi:RNA polymerase sigma factor [Rhizomicrobium electricum]|uniref:Sigma-70 family RNA polymerase sigma factor n=1 Tax=Rhizomicrobium electricum TaxID=480070 RepID=A0ABP3QAT9_9PROT|nr:sigma-70 family RNA polymerase sigma factor [Rhizomicrobium electricum]NIJ49481.1 RNA polymerase sigma-70 factor (ECF subfamily) [Rhizomicrobium electricum]
MARNVLPHEALVRDRLKRLYVATLDVDDVIQEMYARILAAPSLESVRYPRQYAIQTARGIVIDHLRRSRVVSIDACENLEELDIEFPETSAEERLGFRGEIQEVAGALAQLPRTCRETLILRRVEGLSQRETAQRLGVTEKVIESQMARGVAMLVKVFGRGGKSRAHSSNNQVERVTSEDGSVKRRD